MPTKPKGKSLVENVPSIAPVAGDSNGDSLGLELKQAREGKGLSLSALGATTGISRTALHQYETGKTKPGAREIIKLCQALEISPNRLLLGHETPYPVDGLFTGLFALSKTKPIEAAMWSALFMPLAARVLSKVGSETLFALATLADETLRARDPEAFQGLSKWVAELGKMDIERFSALSPEEQQTWFHELQQKLGSPPVKI